jgi:hypothetical protein
MVALVVRALLALSLVFCVAGCGGHKPARQAETSRDVEQRLMRAHTGPLANPTSVSCRRENSNWWRCDVTLSREGLGQSTAELRVPARL